MVVNYMSAHDNNTLWDKLALSNADNTVEERLAMNRLGATILMVSKGTVFFQAGEEMLRTKPKGDGAFDENSYKSSDAVNNINWSVLKEGNREYETMLYYKGLIEMRKTYGIFTDDATVITHEELGSGIVILTYDDGNGGKATVVLNPHNTALPCTLEGEWNLVADGESAGADVIAKESGSVTVDRISIKVYVNDALLK
jgi:pullulanase